MTRRMPGLVALMLLSACMHSDAFGPVGYGAAGPRNPGPEARVAGASDVADWTLEGNAFLYVGPCFGRNRAVNAAGDVPSIVLVPAQGGSAVWERCEDHLSIVAAHDSVEYFAAAAMQEGGALAFVERTRTAFLGVQPPFPVLSHADLWLGDTALAFGNRRKLATLYHDSLGTPTVGPTVVNWLVDLAWIDQNHLAALGQNVNPNGVITPLGLVIVDTRADSAALKILPGSEGAQRYGYSVSSHSFIITRDLTTLESLPASGGAPQVVGQLPSDAEQSVSDISCRETLCLLLTSARSGAAAYWSITLPGDTLSLLRSAAPPALRARISPLTNDVLVSTNAGIFLYDDLIH